MGESSFYARVSGPAGCPVPHLPHTARKPLSLATVRFPGTIPGKTNMVVSAAEPDHDDESRGRDAETPPPRRGGPQFSVRSADWLKKA